MFAGSQKGGAVAVKIAEDAEYRIRLHSGSLCYAWLAGRGLVLYMLPTFWAVSHTFLDVLVSSLKESALASWSDVVALRMKSSRDLTQYLTYSGLNLFFDGSHVASEVKHEGLEPRK